MRRYVLAVLALTLALSACSNLGLGEASCLPPDRGVSAANILTIQAVPDAKYTPCLDELRLGWDTVEWFAEDGRAGFKITRSISPFLTATVTPSCDVTGATQVESEYEDIQRYEDIESHAVDIGITIIPSAERPLLAARLLVADLEGTEIDDRPVVFTIDENINQQVGHRVNFALLQDQYVWVMSELDRGNWYFTFEGGCITYEFNASGRLAETVAADAEDALGFYPASVVVEVARRQGLDF